MQNFHQGQAFLYLYIISLIVIIWKITFWHLNVKCRACPRSPIFCLQGQLIGTSVQFTVEYNIVKAYTARQHLALKIPKVFDSFANHPFSIYFLKRKCWFALILCNLRSKRRSMAARFPCPPPAAFFFFSHQVQFTFDTANLAQSMIFLHPLLNFVFKFSILQWIFWLAEARRFLYAN